MKGSSGLRLTSLDGVRGLAALVVLIHHNFLAVPALAAPYYGPSISHRYDWLTFTPLHLIWAGTESVYVFFVLSGIVLTFPVVRAVKFDWLAYYPARIIRLYVPVVASVILAFIFAAIVSRHSVPSQGLWLKGHDIPLSVPKALVDMLLLPGTSTLNGPLWSLRWEVLFSLLLPAYIWVIVKSRRFGWLGIVAALLVIVAANSVIPSWLAYLAMFMLGVVMAVRWADVERLAARISGLASARVLWSGILVVALCCLTAGWWLQAVPRTITMPLEVLSAAVIVFVASGWDSARNLLDRRVPQWLGRISFSLYLTHEPIVISVAHLLPTSAIWFTGLISIPIALVFAWLFFRFIEAPSHRLERLVKTRIKARASAQVPDVSAAAG